VAASIRCNVPNKEFKETNDKNSEVVLSLSGTSLLPGNEKHPDPPVGKQVQIMIYGTKGAIIYCGDSEDVKSGRLELRRTDTDGKVEYPLGNDYGFEFENLDTEGTGPESLQSFIQACLSNYDNSSEAREDVYVGADSLVGLRAVQVLEAMYRSHHEKKAVQVKQG
jgi:predicted dehydrogenase